MPWLVLPLVLDLELRRAANQVKRRFSTPGVVGNGGERGVQSVPHVVGNLAVQHYCRDRVDQLIRRPGQWNVSGEIDGCTSTHLVVDQIVHKIRPGYRGAGIENREFRAQQRGSRNHESRWVEVEHRRWEKWLLLHV